MIWINIFVFISILNLGLSQEISPRKQIQDYLYANGCNNYLLNKILLSIINNKILEKIIIMYTKNIYLKINKILKKQINFI